MAVGSPSPSPSPALAGYDFEKSRIARLLEEKKFPTIGEIAWANASDVKWAPYRMPQDEYLLWRKDQWHPFFWDLLDQELGRRLDYRLWRQIIKSKYPSQHSSRWPTIYDTAREALESPDNTIVWGTLSILSVCLTSKRKALPDVQQQEIATQCEYRLHCGLAPVPGGHLVCALVKALTWSAIQNVRNHHGRLTVHEVLAYFDEIEKSIGEAAPEWRSGDNFWTLGESIELEQRNERTIIPYDRIEFQIRLAVALSTALNVAGSAVQILDAEADQLLERTCLLAFSCWRLATVPACW